MSLPTDESGEDPPEYAVIVSDLADAEARSAYQWLHENTYPEYAGRWLEGLTRAIEALAFLPRSHAVARENDLYDVEVRRMLYHGPSKRHDRKGTTYRVLFHIIEPNPDEKALSVSCTSGMVPRASKIRDYGAMIDDADKVTTQEATCHAGRSVSYS